MKITLRTLSAILLVSGVIALTGCQTTPQPSERLEAARAHVADVARMPVVNRQAAGELREAQDHLAEAERLWEDRADPARVSHHATMAMRQADLAVEAARSRTLDQRAEQLSNEREQLRLEARAARAERGAERERTERTRAEAAQLAEAAERARAERARALAEQQRREAEIGRQSAEEQRLLAEQRAAELERQTARMQAEAEQLQQQLAELEARPTERGLVLTMGADVLFDFDSDAVKPGAQRTVERVATFLNRYPERQVVIEGFTDSVGQRAYNMDLSLRRANSVRDELVRRGVAATRVQTRGYGPDHPVASNANEAGRQLNRRVEIIISDSDEDIPER